MPGPDTPAVPFCWIVTFSVGVLLMGICLLEIESSRTRQIEPDELVSEPIDELEYRPLRLDWRKCLDGSQSGGYVRPYPGADTVVIFLQGGGYCHDAATCEMRVADRNAGLGSSNSWKATCDKTMCNGISSTNCTLNPHFCKATLVYLRYCSGDHWLGGRESAYAFEDGKSFYFSGQLIVDEAIEHLLWNGLIGNRSSVLFGGRSMGGIGAVAHAEAIAERVQRGVAGATVKALSGWALGTPFPRPVDARLAAVGSVEWGASGGPMDQQCDPKSCWELYGPTRVPPSCARAGLEATPWRCVENPVEVLLKVRTPLMVATSPYSALALGSYPLNRDTCPLVANYTRGSFAALRQLQLAAAAAGGGGLSGGLGLFSPSCWRHSVSWDHMIGEVSFLDAVWRWFTKNETVALIDRGCSADRPAYTFLKNEVEEEKVKLQALNERAKNLVVKVAKHTPETPRMKRKFDRNYRNILKLREEAFSLDATIRSKNLQVAKLTEQAEEDARADWSALMELRQHLGIVKTRKSQKAEKNANRNSRKKASKNISLSLELEAQEATSKELVWKEDVHGRLFENVTSFFDDGTWSSRLCIRVLQVLRERAES